MATPVSPPDTVIASVEYEPEFNLQSQCSQDLNNNNLLLSTELEAKGLADHSVITEDFAINSVTCHECCIDNKFGRTQKICLTCYDIVLTDSSAQQSTQDVPPTLTTTNSCHQYSNAPALTSPSSTAQIYENIHHEFGNASPSNSSTADGNASLLPWSTADFSVNDVSAQVARSSVNASTEFNDIASLPSSVGSLPHISECEHMKTLSHTQLSQPQLPEATTLSSTLVEDPSNKLPAQQAIIHLDTTAVSPA